MGVQFENNYPTEMCSGSEAGWYLRLIYFVYHATLGLGVMKKKRSSVPGVSARPEKESVTVEEIEFLGFRVQGSGFGVQSSEFRVQGSEL